MTCNLTHSCLPAFPQSLDGERNYEERYYLLFSESNMLTVRTKKGFLAWETDVCDKNFLDRNFCALLKPNEF